MDSIEMEIVDANYKRKMLRKWKRMERELGDDWIGSEFSCCFCFHIIFGVKLIQIWWVINVAFLVWQINGVTDDGSSKGEVAGPKFYFISYLCLIPFVRSFWAMFSFNKYGESENTRAGLVSGSLASIYSVIALYIWFFVYFVTLQEENYDQMNRILLVNCYAFIRCSLTLYTYLWI